MNRFLKVEIYPHLFSTLMNEPKTLMVPFNEDRIYFKTSKGWLFAEVKGEGKHLATAFLEEEPTNADDVINHDSYRVALNIVNCPFRKATRIFDDIDIYLSVVFK